MRWNEIINENGGLVVKGVNTTPDVQPGEIARQAAKFGNKVSSDGLPPTWTGSKSSTRAKNTINKGKPFYGKNGLPLKENYETEEDDPDWEGLDRGYDSPEYEKWVRASQGYWITSEGEILPCSYDHDDYFAASHHNNIANDHYGVDDDSGMEKAYQNGWIRVRINDGQFNIEYHSSKVTRKAYRVLLKKIDEFDGVFNLEDYQGAHTNYSDKRQLKVAMSRLNNA